MVQKRQPDPLALAGLLDEERGFLSVGKLPIRGARIPGIRRLSSDGTNLLWSWHSEAEGEEQVAISASIQSTQMLDTFRKIRSGRAVERFARRFGVLGLCGDHRLPNSHRFTGDGFCPLAISDDGLYIERVEDWVRIAGEVTLLLELAMARRNGAATWKATIQQAWSHATDAAEQGSKERPPFQGAPPKARPVSRASFRSITGLELGADLASNRYRYSGIIDEWLQLGAVRPLFSWLDNEPTFALIGGQSSFAFGALAIQLMMSVGLARDQAICSGCGDIYLRRTRMPRAGQRNFCPACVDAGLPNRLHQRESRARKQHTITKQALG